MLVQRVYGKSLDRSLHKQVFSLVERFGSDDELYRKFYDGFWAHFYRTGELLQAYELGERFGRMAEERGAADDVQRSYGNQALILQAWGRLEEAMELLKKMEMICRGVGLTPYLKWCYTRQIEILEESGKKDEAEAIREKLETLGDVISA